MKYCRRCKTEKALDEFYKTKGKPNSYCKACQNELNKDYLSRHRDSQLAYRAQWARENRAKRLATYKKYERKQLLARHGLSPDWFEKQNELQGGVCAICKQPETRVHHLGTLMSLAVDHDHRTGKVRGLLCSACNMNLHRVEDSGWLAKATEYLDKFKGEFP